MKKRFEGVIKRHLQTSDSFSIVSSYASVHPPIRVCLEEKTSGTVQETQMIQGHFPNWGNPLASLELFLLTMVGWPIVTALQSLIVKKRNYVIPKRNENPKTLDFSEQI